MRKTRGLWLVACLLTLSLSVSCTPAANPSSTPKTTASSLTSATATTTQPSSLLPSPKTTTPAVTTPKPATTAAPASSLYIPPGQQFTGGIQTRGAVTNYFIDTAPLCAYGGSPLSGYTWSVANLSALPVGTTFDPLTGMFHASGGTLLAGTHNFKMEVSDGSTTATGSFSLLVRTGEMLPVAQFQQSGAATIPLPNAGSGVGYGASLWAMGSNELPWTWTVSGGVLPPGMTLDRSTGVVRGTPLSSAVGNTYRFTISVKDKTGKEAVSLSPNGQPPMYTILVAK